MPDNVTGAAGQLGEPRRPRRLDRLRRQVIYLRPFVQVVFPVAGTAIAIIELLQQI
ncbi:hypothetical protein [Nocardia asteroides]|uniref:hypothetical protein n=1 Tax=Nocardia asteroides TaxID=1824 RepID=UPI001E57F393|nr:hypothetical protein [Nocardia asteroides]UGT58812.1 hypothetical protein LTT85_33210 [Nocardia asteroides]